MPHPARPPDPAEDEIARLCEAIRSDWTPGETEARKHWQPGYDGKLVRPNQESLPGLTIPEVRS